MADPEKKQSDHSSRMRGVSGRLVTPPRETVMPAVSDKHVTRKEPVQIIVHTTVQ